MNVDEAYTQDKRSYDKSMLGILAMSTSPDANCGVVRDLTLEPKIIGPRGYIEINDDNLENLKDEIINLLNNKQDATSKLSTLNANKENINLRKETIDLDIREIKYKIDKKIEEVSKASAKLEDKTKSMESLKNDEVKTNNDFNILLNKSNNIEKQIQDSKYSLNDYKSKLNIYIEMENHYEGFNKGVKEVLKNKNLQGIQGALGQVIEVPSKFEKSIEASLGAYMQNIITNDESSAKFAINYLKKNNLGRVTFLPMNIIKSNKIDTRNIKVGTSFIGIASDLIKFDDKYRNIIENILGRTIIIDNIDNAIKFSYPEKTIEIYSKENADTYTLVIKNYGRGMTEEEINNASPFIQHNRSYYEQQGNGLGLAITQRIADFYNVKLEMHSVKDSYLEAVLIFKKAVQLNNYPHYPNQNFAVI